MKYTIELFNDLEAFAVRAMGANTVNKIEKLEKDFSEWKLKNGFDAKSDAEDLLNDFRTEIPSEIEKHYGRIQQKR